MIHKRSKWYNSDAVAVSIVISTMLVSIVGGSYLMGMLSCHWTWANTDIERRYVFPGGCQVKNGAAHWIPAVKFRAVD